MIGIQLLGSAIRIEKQSLAHDSRCMSEPAQACSVSTSSSVTFHADC